MSQSVFISRDLSGDESLIQRLHNRGIAVTAVSLIEAAAVEFNPYIPLTDWIFFSSKNGVRFFFDQPVKITTQKFGAVGEGTASMLRKHVPVDFTGKHIDTHETAIDFKQVVKNETVLFPQARGGWRTIAGVFDPGKITEVICYETREVPVSVGHPDVLVFSSPSNVDSFFRVNSIQANQKIIAFGHSTGITLQKHGISEFKIPISLSEDDLFRAIIDAVES